MDRRRILCTLAVLLSLTVVLSSGAMAVGNMPLPFSDVRPEDSFYEAVSDVYARGVMKGTGGELFSPYESATRAMMATVFYRMEGSPAGSADLFPDVPDGAWYTQAVRWAAEEKIYQGYDDGLFHPAESITKEQLCVILSRYARYKGETVTAEYTPSEGVTFSPWAVEACAWALEYDYFPKDGETFDMTAPALRWEIAEALYRFDRDAGTLQAVTDGALSYLLYRPAQARAGMPLIVYLHGGSGKGDDLSLLTREDGFPKYLSEGALGEVPAYVVIPQLPTEKKGWSNVATELGALIGEVCARYQVDDARVALTGHSMGGTGTWAVALAMPDRFSCIVPMSGSIKLSRENLQTLSHLPIRAFVGAADTIVDPASTLRFVEALQKTGANAQVTVLPQTDHFSVPNAYLNEEFHIISWMLEQVREG